LPPHLAGAIPLQPRRSGSTQGLARRMSAPGLDV